MSRLMRFYTYGLLGAIGGLIGWQISNILGLSFTDNLFLSEVIVGALLGGVIGLLIGFGEGFAAQNFLFGLKKALLSALLGAVGGAIALPIAEGVFLFIGGQTWSRPIGWAIFGLLTGLATGITGGAQLWKGGLGGMIGGALGGVLLEAARAVFADPLTGKVAGAMTAEPQTVSVTDGVAEAFARMTDGHFRHLPVMEGERCIGLLSVRDVPTEYRMMYERYQEMRRGL